MQLHQAQRELIVKVVYYGPGLSGKTTNLQVLHRRAAERVRGHLVTTQTSDDRTLFFDLLPVFFKTTSGFKVKLKVFTVPGQVLHNATRRLVLQGADAVAFIADARHAAVAENNTYWRNLVENMREIGLDEATPVVIQFNKRDLPDTKTDAELEEARLRGAQPVIGAVASQGVGVVETFHALLQQAYRALDGRANLAKNAQLSEEEFLGQVFSQMNLEGTALAGQFPLPAEAETA